MKFSKLGLNGPLVSTLGLGSWHTWERMKYDDVVEVLAEAVSGGINLFDVAYYNSGPHRDDSPTDLIFGRAMREAGVKREQYVFCAKLFLWEYPGQSLKTQIDILYDRVGIEFGETAVLSDYRAIEIPRVVEDISIEIESGRLNSWGINNWPYMDYRAAVDFAMKEGLHAPSFAQLKYSIPRRAMVEGEYYAAEFESGRLGLQASDIFEGGILAGKKNTMREIGADPGSIREEIKIAATEVEKIAAELQATPAQFSLAFCLTNPNVNNILLGVSSLRQLRENIQALKLYEVHGGDIRRLTEHLWLDRGRARADGVRLVKG